MAKSVDFLVNSDQSMADFAKTLNTLLDIDLLPAEAEGKAYYAFRAMTLTLDLYELANGAHKAGEVYRYHISINGIFGSELQRTKWTEDWGYGVMQRLKDANYPVKRIDPLSTNQPDVMAV